MIDDDVSVTQLPSQFLCELNCDKHAADFKSRKTKLNDSSPSLAILWLGSRQVNFDYSGSVCFCFNFLAPFSLL